MAYLRALPALAHLQLGGDRQAGVQIVQRALEEPLLQLAANAGAEQGVVVHHVKAQSGAHGYDAATGEYVDLLTRGIIDPTKVERIALQNAASLAGLVLTTEVLIAEEPEEQTEGTPQREHMACSARLASSFARRKRGRVIAVTMHMVYDTPPISHWHASGCGYRACSPLEGQGRVLV